ncbi:MAG: SRPBCC family protein [Verrucomicrobia bacterium]|nr:SRPBCC family protein [Verrucomicrobiota bacterium]
MKILIKILGGLAALIALLVVVAFFLPRQYRIERSLVFDAKPEQILAPCADLREWRAWGVWYQRDPELKPTYSNPPTGVGSWCSWQSKNEGNGKMTISSLAPTKIVYALEFPDFNMKSTGTMEVRPEGEKFRLFWSDEGDLGMNPMNRWFGLFLDKLIGRDFEDGLKNLKKIVDKK